MQDDFRVPECKCPCCYRPLDGAGVLHGSGPPDPSDVTVCVYCGCALQFTKDLRLERLTPAESVKMRQEAPEAWNSLKKAQLAVLFKIADERTKRAGKALLN